MSRGKRQFDEDAFDEYAFHDERIRGDGRQRLEDMPASDQDYGVGPGYLGRIGQSPRSPSVRGDDEIRPRRGRSSSPDDGYHYDRPRALRKVGDAFDPDEADEVFERVSSAVVSRAIMSRVVFRDWCFDDFVARNADSTEFGNFAFLKQQRVLNGDSRQIRLNNVQLRGCLYLHTSPVNPVPEAVFVEVVVAYDRFRSELSGYYWQLDRRNKAIAPFSWSDVFESPSSNFTYPTNVDDMDIKLFNFTNPEFSNRVRIMFRKVYKLSSLDKRNNFQSINGTVQDLTSTPPQIFAVSLGSTAKVVDEGPTQLTNVCGSSAIFIDEFVNLCGLPARYRAGDSGVDTAVNTEGGVYLGIRSTCFESDTRQCYVRAFVNTRLNFNMECTDGATFF